MHSSLMSGSVEESAEEPVRFPTESPYQPHYDADLIGYGCEEPCLLVDEEDDDVGCQSSGTDCQEMLLAVDVYPERVEGSLNPKFARIFPYYVEIEKNWPRVRMLDFNGPFVKVQENECLRGEWALYQNAFRFDNFCSGFVSVMMTRETERYRGCATALTPLIYDPSAKELVMVWVTNRHVIYPKGDHEKPRAVQMSCGLSRATSDFYTSQFEIAEGLFEDFKNIAEEKAIAIPDFPPDVKRDGTAYEIPELDLCFGTTRYKVSQELALEVIRGFDPPVPSNQIQNEMLVTTVGYPGGILISDYKSLYNPAASEKEAAEQVKLIHEKVFKPSHLSASGGSIALCGDRIGIHNCPTTAGCSGSPIVLTNDSRRLVGIHLGRSMCTAGNYFVSVKHPYFLYGWMRMALPFWKIHLEEVTRKGLSEEAKFVANLIASYCEENARDMKLLGLDICL